jgi:hypothetical protein
MKHSEYTIPNEVADRWQEPFDDLLDEIYWKGYSHHLVEESPETYQREFFHFIAQYDESPCFINGVPDAYTNPQGSGVSHE